MDNELPNKHLLANIFYISKTEKVRQTALWAMTEELWLEPVSWLLGESDFSYHGLQSPSQGKGSFFFFFQSLKLSVPPGVR